MSCKAFVTIGSKKYELALTTLTVGSLQEQITKVSKPDQQGNTLVKITNGDGYGVETDQHVQYVDVGENKENQINDDCDSNNAVSLMEEDIIHETLDFKNHWNADWIKSNVEAAKIVEQMTKQSEQGLVVVAKKIHQWHNAASTKLVEIDDNFPFITIINNDKDEKYQFGDYWVYVIKKKLVILNGINIDGNIYAIDCEIRLEENANITTQIFFAKNVIIHQKFKHIISPIQWNARFHYEIPVRLQGLQDKAKDCFKKNVFDYAIFEFQKALDLSINAFGPNHAYVADSYNSLGLSYDKKGHYEKAIECYEKSLKITLNIFGKNHAWVANLYNHLGHVYDNKQQYEDAINYYEKSLYIWEQMFGNTNRVIGDLNWNLGRVFEEKDEMKTAGKYYEKTWKTYSRTLGDWHPETLEAKEKVKTLSG
ncbi:hypothetical protein RFI_26167 [Reticulomyxa filosa]|uniref:Uncharacterized protein n=1 Tax=Reticulomyxa filosa TaxID=46433 RepID=X6MBG3_RETFI|nr:hypothetical protein RFI_26167 [Reticulomyxa filosa]|eukprot:ETO11209.1 hypothetical protein RFI_26167 [Reticulomyxa filosa]